MREHQLDRRSFVGSLAAIVPAPAFLSLIDCGPQSRVLWQHETKKLDAAGRTVIRRGKTMLIADGDKGISLFCESTKMKRPIPGFCRQRASFFYHTEHDQQARRIGERFVLLETFVEHLPESAHA